MREAVTAASGESVGHRPHARGEEGAAAAAAAEYCRVLFPPPLHHGRSLGAAAAGAAAAHAARRAVRCAHWDGFRRGDSGVRQHATAASGVPCSPIGMLPSADDVRA